MSKYNITEKKDKDAAYRTLVSPRLMDELKEKINGMVDEKLSAMLEKSDASQQDEDTSGGAQTAAQAKEAKKSKKKSEKKSDKKPSAAGSAAAQSA